MTETDAAEAGTMLTERTSDIVLMTLDKLENQVEAEHGWDIHPALFVIREIVNLVPAIQKVAIERAGADPDDLAGFAGGVSLSQVPIPSSTWAQFAHRPMALLTAIGDEMADDPLMIAALLASGPHRELDDDQRTIGFALFCEAWQRRSDSDPQVSIHDHPEERDDEVRIVAAMDLDYRHYQVTRLRHAGTRTVRKVTAEEAEKMVADSDSPQVQWVRTTHPSGRPAMPHGLARMIGAIRSGRP